MHHLQAFKVSKNNAGEIVVYVKHRPSHKHWGGLRPTTTMEGAIAMSLHPSNPPHRLFKGYQGKLYPDLTQLPELEHKPVLPAEIKLLEQHITANSSHLRRVFGDLEAEGHIDSLMEDIRSLQITTARPCPWDTSLYQRDRGPPSHLDDTQGDDDDDDDDDDITAMVETSYMRSSRPAVGPMEDAAYSVGNFVAVQADDSDAGSNVHFWVGQIKQRPFKRSRQVVMVVQWYEPQRNKQYTDWLFPCVHTIDRQRQAWTDTVEVCTVLAQFKVTHGTEAFKDAVKMPKAVHRELTAGGSNFIEVDAGTDAQSDT